MQRLGLAKPMVLTASLLAGLALIPAGAQGRTSADLWNSEIR